MFEDNPRACGLCPVDYLLAVSVGVGIWFLILWCHAALIE